jgi:hypothetical protein
MTPPHLRILYTDPVITATARKNTSNQRIPDVRHPAGNSQKDAIETAANSDDVRLDPGHTTPHTPQPTAYSQNTMYAMPATSHRMPTTRGKDTHSHTGHIETDGVLKTTSAKNKEVATKGIGGAPPLQAG